MKHRALHLSAVLVFSVALSFNALAQNESDKDSTQTNKDGDTTTISWGKRSRMVITRDSEGNRQITLQKRDDSDPDTQWKEDDGKRHSNSPSTVDFLALDLGVTNYYVDGNIGVDAAPSDLELKSFRPGGHFALHFLPTRVSLIGKGVFNLKTAITIDYNNYYFVNDIRLVPKQERVTIERTGIDYTRNKLFARYAQIPLLFNLNTDPRNNEGLSLSFGGYAGVLWEARTKQDSGIEGKQKIDDDFNLNKFRYGLTARLDIRWFDIYLNYNLSPLFEDGSGVDTQTFTAGFNLLQF